MSTSTPKRKPPRLRTVLLIANLLILLLPLGSIGVLRLYENELVRRTQAELIAQGAFVAAMYRQALHDVVDEQGLDEDDIFRTLGVPADPEYLIPPDENEEIRPIPTLLDRARDPVAPPAPDPSPGGDPDPLCAEAGRRIMPVLLEAKQVTLAGIRVVDFLGVQVASTRGRAGPDLTTWDEVPRALRGEVVSRMRERISDEPRPALDSFSRRTRVRVFVAIPVVEGDRVLGAIVLSRTPVSLTKALYENRTTMIWTAVFLLAVVLAVTFFVSVTVSRPVRNLVDQAEAIAAGDERTATPLDDPGTHEIGRLSEAIVTMATNLAEREDYIRTFARGVSHEFKTPLTSIKGAVELLRDHLDEMSAEERSQFLGTLESQTDRLESLVRRLLDLARADVARPGDAESDVVGFTRSILEREAASGRQASFVTDVERARVNMDEEALDTLLMSLLTNAWTHGGDDVRIAVRRSGDAIEIDVSDDGPGISEANAERIFRDFFTTARETGGTGLGLSIVRSLAHSHGGDVEYLREDERTVFRVTLPG